jgi:hypothetical protein
VSTQRILSRRIHRSAVLLSMALVGCSGGADGSPAISLSSAPTGTAATLPVPSLPSVSPSANVGPAILPVYPDGLPRPVDAGAYTTGYDGFFPGLAVTIPSRWSATETDDGELALHPDDRRYDALLLWRDMSAVVTNNRTGTVGQPLTNVGMSATAIMKWLTTTSDFAILNEAKSVTIGNGIKGVQLTLTTSNTANFDFTDCPDSPHCVAIFTDAGHWGGNFYAIGGAEVSQIFVAALEFPSGNHTFYVVLDAKDSVDLAQFASEAQPIIDSLVLPITYVNN